MRSIGLDGALKADFGSGLWEGGPIGIPYDVVDAAHASARTSASTTRPSPTACAIRSRAASTSRAGRPPTATATRCCVDRSRCRLYELFALRKRGRPLDARARVRPGACAGRAAAGGLDERRRRRAADPAAARPLPGGQARADHARSAHDGVRDAARVRLPRPPLRVLDSDPALPRMGERLRLKRSVDISGLPRQARVVARAMREYGLIVADNGSDWFVCGAPHAGWDNDQLQQLGACAAATSRSSRQSTRPTRPPVTPSFRLPASRSSSSAPTSSRRQPRSVRTSGSGLPRRAATTTGARSARAAISS